MVDSIPPLVNTFLNRIASLPSLLSYCEHKINQVINVNHGLPENLFYIVVLIVEQCGERKYTLAFI